MIYLKVLKSALLLTLILACLCAVSGCSRIDNPENEIKLKIDLDLKEDIGLLVIDYTLGEESGSGGVSNADKTKLEKDDVLYFSLDRQHFENIGEGAVLTVRFTVITEYNEPNYDNVYTKGLSISTEPIEFYAEFGKTYRVEMTGGIEEGYAVNIFSG